MISAAVPLLLLQFMHVYTRIVACVAHDSDDVCDFCSGSTTVSSAAATRDHSHLHASLCVYGFPFGTTLFHPCPKPQTQALFPASNDQSQYSWVVCELDLCNAHAGQHHFESPLQHVEF